MRIRFCSALVVLALLLAPAVSSAAPAPSLDTFLSTLSAPGAAPAAPASQWMGTGCFQTYQACLSGCGGNAACEQTCQCNYYECRGMDLPTFCL